MWLRQPPSWQAGSSAHPATVAENAGPDPQSSDIGRLNNGAPQHVVYGRVEKCRSSTSTSSDAVTPAAQAMQAGEAAGLRKRDVVRLTKWRINPETITFRKQDKTSDNSDSVSVKSSQSASRSVSVSEGAHKGKKTRATSEPPNPVEAAQAAAKHEEDIEDEELLHQFLDSSDDDIDPTEAESQLEAGSSVADIDISQVPRDANGELTSKGSIGHANGTCKVCIFASSTIGCTNGVNCSFCHLPHKPGKRKTKLRPCKGKRERYRKLLTRLTYQVEQDPENFSVDKLDLPPSIMANDARKAKLAERMQLLVEQVKATQRAGGSPGGAEPKTLLLDQLTSGPSQPSQSSQAYSSIGAPPGLWPPTTRRTAGSDPAVPSMRRPDHIMSL
mmetsp:Transcript_28666/g.89123  ORF Transcript_28666/g.89123 Transcript_28666/m.89123 type:complete len:387 (-) Transcript_28666:59-1219(-)